MFPYISSLLSLPPMPALEVFTPRLVLSTEHRAQLLGHLRATAGLGDKQWGTPGLLRGVTPPPIILYSGPALPPFQH